MRPRSCWCAVAIPGPLRLPNNRAGVSTKASLGTRVHRASRRQRLAPVSELLTLLEPSKADLCRNRQKDHEVEARDEDVPPATERSGEHPARVRVEGASQDGLAFVTFTGPLEGRIARLPEVVVGIELGVPETDRERHPQRGRSRPGRAHDVNPVGHVPPWC